MGAEAFEATQGCATCWPADPEAAWEAGRKLRPEIDLIDESHFHAALRSCGRCGQCYLTIFTETIDWVDGEDPQQQTRLPLTAEEATSLRSLSSPPEESALEGLGAGRRSLRREYDKGAEPRSYWSLGLRIDRHD